MNYYEVAPTKIIRQTSNVFTYSSELPLEPGHIVLVEVGKRQLTGIVMRETKKPDYETKPIIKVVENMPLPEQLLRVALWLSDYYATHAALVLQLLLPRGVEKQRRTRQNATKVPVRKRTKIVFNKYQSVAINTILRGDVTATYLLHGVTGSGKTAVYIEMARQILEKGRSVILLVPEIALTSQLVDEFSSHFGDIVLTHSRQSEAERHTTWRNILTDPSPRIVIGPRSALFLPLQDIGMVIIDEAHEPSFKQEQSPKYSALRAARILAETHRAKLVLGSATPAITDYYMAKNSHSPIIEMPERAQEATTPDVSLVDMTKRQSFRKHRFLSDTLLQEIEKVLSSGNQVLIFHNRRGSASITLCDNCGWQAICNRCYVPMVLHTDSFQLRCHICGNHEKVPTECPVCHNSSIIHKGIGTKLVEAELVKLFPLATIRRFDGDSENGDSIEARYSEIYEGKIDIIIGTQVVAKGLDLPKLRLVGVVQADTGLSLPDFAASERTFQLLAQVIGRIGRSSSKTSAIIQAYNTSHPAITDGLTQNYAAFYEKAIAERRRASFPPYCFLLQLTCVYKTEAAAVRNARLLASGLKALNLKIEILGPSPAFYERQHGTHRWQLLIKSKQRSELIKVLQHLPTSHWQFELDPISLL